MCVDAASAKSAEESLSLLRKSLSSLPAVPLSTIEKPTATMTQWLLNNKTPDDITIEDECELRSPEEAGGIIRVNAMIWRFLKLKTIWIPAKRLLSSPLVGQTVFHSLLMKICLLNVCAFLI